MAEVPTPEMTARAILGCMVDEYKVRAGESAPLIGIQMKLHPDYTADDLNAALEFMHENEWIETGRHGFIHMTDKGYSEA